MFFVILGIIGFIVAILAVFIIRKIENTSFFGLQIAVTIIGTIFLFAGLFGTREVISDIYDICDTERTINAYIDSEYSEGLYCAVCHLDNVKAWADTPFSLWSSKKIKVLRDKAVESYIEIRSGSKQPNKPKNEPKSYKMIIC